MLCFIAISQKETTLTNMSLSLRTIRLALADNSDGALKMNQAIPGYFDEFNLRELTGIEPSGEPISIEEIPNE